FAGIKGRPAGQSDSNESTSKQTTSPASLLTSSSASDIGVLFHVKTERSTHHSFFLDTRIGVVSNWRGQRGATKNDKKSRLPTTPEMNTSRMTEHRDSDDISESASCLEQALIRFESLEEDDNNRWQVLDHW